MTFVTSQQIAAMDLGGKQERLAGPEMVQATSAKRYPEGEGGDELHWAFCKAGAPAATTIACYLDYDGSNATAWTARAYEEGEACIGSDSKVYRCTNDKGGDAQGAAESPVGGANYAQYWTVITEITVYCNIFGGGYLNTAVPLLKIGDDIIVYEKDGLWHCEYSFNGAVFCEVQCDPEG